jgi:hypothetical protein
MSTDNIQCILEKPKEAVPYVLGLTSPLHVREAQPIGVVLRLAG